MNIIPQLFSADSFAYAMLIISLVAALGLGLGCVRIFGIHLGIAGVLFAGLIFGHFNLSLSDHVLEFVRDFGLVLFVYTLGLQVGPGFIASMRREGLSLNLMAASIVVLGVAVTIAVSHFGQIQIPAAVGMFSGSTTNTPSLAAAQEALKDIPGLSVEMLKLPGLGYAVSYPFGIIGIILTMILIRLLFRIHPQKEAEMLAQLSRDRISPLTALNFEVRNPNLDGVRIKDIPALQETGVIISRVYHNRKIEIAHPDTKLQVGDVILAVGSKAALDQFRIIVGIQSDIDLRTIPSGIMTKRILVTRKEVLGKTLEELDLLTRYGVTVTRVSRVEIEMSASAGFRLQFADTILAVGEEDDIKQAAQELGDSPRQLNYPQLIPIFVGIALGVILGSWPFYFPGMPAAVKLGLAGGPLIIAIILSRLGSIGPLVWYMPISANFMLREFGIVLFLACVGLKSGDQFVATLIHGDGFYWMGWAVLINLIPLLIVGLFARLKFKLNYMTLCGLLAGSLTDPPALAFANSITSSNAPSVSYATVYPLVTLLRVISAQIIVLLFMY